MSERVLVLGFFETLNEESRDLREKRLFSRRATNLCGRTKFFGVRGRYDFADPPQRSSITAGGHVAVCREGKVTRPPCVPSHLRPPG